MSKIVANGEGCTMKSHEICSMLVDEGKVENIWKIWELKCANMDTWCSINICWIYNLFPDYSLMVDYIRNSKHEKSQGLLERVARDENNFEEIRNHITEERKYI